MMIGQTFAPLGNPAQQRPSGSGGAGNVGQAIQTLSLRIPRIVGAGSIAPNALLTSPGSAGLPRQGINPVLDAILRGILGNFGSQQVAPSAMGGQPTGILPPPRVIPGAGDSQGTLSERPSSTRPEPLFPGPAGRRDDVQFPAHTREGFIPGGGFTAGRGGRF